MFELNITHKNTYSEIAQANPLRWRVMLRDKKVLHSQSGLIKCKDFFNDIVAWKHGGHQFNIYSFNNQVKFNRFGLYMLLTSITDKKQFLSNLDALNERLKKDLNTKISTYSLPKDENSLVIHIPNPVWQNTYYVSLATMMIRLCNYKFNYKTWEDFFAPDSPLNTVETAFNDQAKAYTKEKGFTLPEKYRGLWYNARMGWNSRDKAEIRAAIIHNNGCSDWATSMAEAK